MTDNNIRDNQNYMRISNGDVFTGKQIKNLLAVASKQMQDVILMDITETEKPATRPGSKYGVR